MRRYMLSVPAVLVVTMSACTNIHALKSSDVPVNGKVITEEMIAKSSANTAWDVVQQTGFYRMINDPSSGSSGVHSHRGRTSISLPGSDVPRLIVDGARVADLGRLHDIPAVSIAWIELLGGIAGASEEGTNTGAGVIRVISKAGR